MKNIYIPGPSLSCLGTITSIKSGEVRLSILELEIINM
jgi:hypothetical protein